jgi:hypothetical protein
MGSVFSDARGGRADAVAVAGLDVRAEGFALAVAAGEAVTFALTSDGATLRSAEEMAASIPLETGPTLVASSSMSNKSLLDVTTTCCVENNSSGNRVASVSSNARASGTGRDGIVGDERVFDVNLGGLDDIAVGGAEAVDPGSTLLTAERGGGGLGAGAIDGAVGGFGVRGIATADDSEPGFNGPSLGGAMSTAAFESSNPRSSRPDSNAMSAAR